MSNVLARNRNLSELEFYNTASEIRAELTRWVMNDKNVPKSYRYVFAIPTTNMLIALFHNITTANTVYAINEHELQTRRDYQTLAVADCEDLLQMLQYIVDTLPVDADKLVSVTEKIEKEVALLKAWRKSNKLIVTKKK